jgi:hypothetical protein
MSFVCLGGVGWPGEGVPEKGRQRGFTSELCMSIGGGYVWVSVYKRCLLGISVYCVDVCKNALPFPHWGT